MRNAQTGMLWSYLAVQEHCTLHKLARLLEDAAQACLGALWALKNIAQATLGVTWARENNAQPSSGGTWALDNAVQPAQEQLWCSKKLRRPGKHCAGMLGSHLGD